jgi:hypothetical protein
MSDALRRVGVNVLDVGASQRARQFWGDDVHHAIR